LGPRDQEFDLRTRRNERRHDANTAAASIADDLVATWLRRARARRSCLEALLQELETHAAAPRVEKGTICRTSCATRSSSISNFLTVLKKMFDQCIDIVMRPSVSDVLGRQSVMTECSLWECHLPTELQGAEHSFEWLSLLVPIGIACVMAFAGRRRPSTK
tara:strand:+ start:92 stop:574 length:483 start_codon:yes stop_codon:yes gene_type:complete